MFLLDIFIGIWLFVQVLFHVNNGAGRITAAYEPRGTNSLCDGKWHKLQANKSKHHISLIIDGNLVHTDNPYIQSTSADTNNPIYVGGYPGRYNNISFPFCSLLCSLSQERLLTCVPFWSAMGIVTVYSSAVASHSASFYFNFKNTMQSGFLLCFSFSSSIVPWQELLLQTLPSYCCAWLMLEKSSDCPCWDVTVHPNRNGT